MQIRSVREENPESIKCDISSIMFDSSDLSGMIGIEGPNCHDAFNVIIFASDILLRRYKDDRSFIKSYFKISNRVPPIKVSIGLTLNTEELCRISDFVVSSEMRSIRRENDERTSNLKIEILRNCVRVHLSRLFADPILEITARDPDLYKEDYVTIRLRIERGLDKFFVLQYPYSNSTVVSKAQSLPKGDSHRISFADLLFDYLSNIEPNLKDYAYIPKKLLDDCKSLDTFDILDKHLDAGNYLGIMTTPSPENAGESFEDIPELIPLSHYLIQSNIELTYNDNVIFFDLIRAVCQSFIFNTHLRSRLWYRNLTKILLERIDPKLVKLEEWVRGLGADVAGDFEKGITMLLNLCGFRAIHVGGNYENACQRERQQIYGISPVSIDVIAFSARDKEVLLIQCCTQWKDVKVNDISTIYTELQMHLSTLEDSPKLHATVVTCASKRTIPPNIMLSNQVKIIDITHLEVLLEEVKKGISPYYMASKIFF